MCKIKNIFYYFCEPLLLWNNFSHGEFFLIDMIFKFYFIWELNTGLTLFCYYLTALFLLKKYCFCWAQDSYLKCKCYLAFCQFASAHLLANHSQWQCIFSWEKVIFVHWPTILTHVLIIILIFVNEMTRFASDTQKWD